MKRVKPTLLCSRCLGFDSCRYNGDIIDSPYIARLGRFCNIIDVCPEVEIGLGVPRDPVRIVIKDKKHKLIQSRSLDDLTEKMNKFIESFIENLPPIHGAVLKYKSPSCATSASKYYKSMEKSPPVGTGPGFFGKAVLDKYDLYPVENEKRLSNFVIREHFLLRLFTFASFSALEKKASGLIKFHSSNKLLFLAYNQEKMRKMGKVAAEIKERGLDESFREYGKLLGELFKKNAGYNAHINVIQHAAGYFSSKIKKEERNYINSLIRDYKEKKAPLSALRAVIHSNIIRFDIEYLRNQTYFNPYPGELSDTGDSGRGRNLKNI